MLRVTFKDPFVWVTACWVGAIITIAPPASAQLPATAEVSPPLQALVAQAERAGLRVLSSRHLILVTDRPPREADGLHELPGIFDEAFAVWCKHYKLDPADHADWQALGCLVVDRDRFRAAGLLPDEVPEGVHAFTTTLLKLNTPTWYTEGIAEFLATHRLAATAPRFQLTPIPAAASDVEQLGRIETIARLRAAGEAPSLDDVFQLRPTLHGTLTSYASAWAAVAFLAGHPRYAKALATAERGPLDARFTARLTKHLDWDEAAARRDFDAFTADLDYGYEFERMTVDWSPGEPVASSEPLAERKTRPYSRAKPTGSQSTGTEANRSAGC
ncbi:MAG: hypothetical protein EBS83_03070 [Planctomycetia bacterium]|nr:hypothetical protein [Planctomycetia bacterium]